MNRNEPLAQPNHGRPLCLSAQGMDGPGGRLYNSLVHAGCNAQEEHHGGQCQDDRKRDRNMRFRRPPRSSVAPSRDDSRYPFLQAIERRVDGTERRIASRFIGKQRADRQPVRLARKRCNRHQYQFLEFPDLFSAHTGRSLFRARAVYAKL